MSPIPALEAVLLDIDGTLVDSNDAHARAWVEALSEAGYDVAFDRVRCLIGKGGDKILPELAGSDKDSTKGKKLETRRREIFMRDHLPKVRSFPGTQALLERMHDDGLRLVAATLRRGPSCSAIPPTMSKLLPRRTSASLHCDRGDGPSTPCEVRLPSSTIPMNCSRDTTSRLSHGAHLSRRRRLHPVQRMQRGFELRGARWRSRRTWPSTR